MTRCAASVSPAPADAAAARFVLLSGALPRRQSCARFPINERRGNTMKKSYVWLLALIAALLVAGCNMQKGPAEQAVAGVVGHR